MLQPLHRKAREPEGIPPCHGAGTPAVRRVLRPQGREPRHHARRFLRPCGPERLGQIYPAQDHCGRVQTQQGQSDRQRHHRPPHRAGCGLRHGPDRPGEHLPQRYGPGLLAQVSGREVRRDRGVQRAAELPRRAAEKLLLRHGGPHRLCHCHRHGELRRHHRFQRHQAGAGR